MTTLGARAAENAVVSLRMYRLLNGTNSGSLFKEKRENIKGKGNSANFHEWAFELYIAAYHVSGFFGCKQDADSGLGKQKN